jgi:glycosyltransferase involved in cell wall biosynthesis
MPAAARIRAALSAMKVSVVVPVYNKGPFLQESFESLFAQTYEDLEIIAIDDRSTDDGLERLLALRDPRLRVERMERNMGHPMATQRGFDLATGRYIVRADADDIHLPQRIERQVAFMEAHPEVGVSSSRLRTFGAEEVEWEVPLDDAACRAEVLFGMPVLDQASIIRTDVIRNHDIRYHPDWPRVGSDRLFFAQFLKYTRYANLPEVLLLYRVGGQNNNHGQSMLQRREEGTRRVFQMLGIEVTEEQFTCHLMLLRAFRRDPHANDIRRLRQWVDELVAMNGRLKLFPEKEFRERTLQAWDRLFHFLPAYGVAPALAHLRSSGHWPMDRVAYLAKHTLNRWLRGAKA